MPIVQALKNKNLGPEHWDQIRTAIGKKQFEPDTTDDYTLDHLLKENVVPYQEQIVEISLRATGEFKLQEAYEEVKKGFNSIPFAVVQYTDKYQHVIEHDKVYEALDLQIS